MTSKKDGFVYNQITQPQAAELSRNMYTNNNFESDLINSYAWDTVIVFIQTFGQSNYWKQVPLSENILKTGIAGDEQLHINDMAGNVLEWTTESYNMSSNTSISRGGSFNSTSNYTTVRHDFGVGNSYSTSRI